jgi:hypothetical protein
MQLRNLRWLLSKELRNEGSGSNELINGRLMTGARPIEQFRAEIEAELAALPSRTGT